MSSFRNWKKNEGAVGALVRRSVCCGMSSHSTKCPKFGQDEQGVMHVKPKSLTKHCEKVKGQILKSGLDVCSICRESLLEGEVVSNSCGHMFHTECLDPWVNMAFEKKINSEVNEFDTFENEDEDRFVGGLRSIMGCFSRFSIEATCPQCREEICAAHQVHHPSEVLAEWQKEYHAEKAKNKTDKKRKRQEIVDVSDDDEEVQTKKIKQFVDLTRTYFAGLIDLTTN
jgi:hypothetical protein